MIDRMPEMPGRKLYFAYGANLCHQGMAVRCPMAVPLKKLEVQNAALVFRGVADIVVRRGESVQGGLWWITGECEEALDQFEGVKHGLYVKKLLPVWRRRNGKIRYALFYQMRESRGVMPPSGHYLDTIAEGYEDFSLDVSFLDRALRESWSEKKITPRLRRRHVARGSQRFARQMPELPA